MPSHPRVLIPVSHPLGGIRTYMLYNLKPLHEAGFRFTFLSVQNEVFDNFKKDVVDWEGTEFIGVNDKGFLSSVAAVRTAVNSGQFSLIHSQGLRSGTITATALFNRWFRKPIPQVITLHDVIIPQNNLGKHKRLKQFFIGFLTRRANVIVPVSSDCAENHLQFFPCWKKGPVKVVPILNGIRINEEKTERTSETDERLPILGGFFGRFMPQKGFDVLFQSLEILDAKGYGEKFRLLATVDRHGYTRETLAAVDNNPTLKKMVQWTETVSDITPLLQKIDVLVMPSRWEACPILPMEVMVAGVPVIGSDCLGLREVLAGSPGITPPVDDAEALADAVIKFIDEPRPLKAAARNYVDEAKRRFDVNTAAEKLLKVYQELTEKPDGHSPAR